jgi:aminoglycoside phosphotransferase (APT) family kinase protein
VYPDLERVRAQVEAWICQSLGCDAPLRFVSLEGATSASLYKIITSGGESFVLRLFTNRPWLEEEPDLAEHEAAILVKATRANLPAPELIAYISQDSPFGIPAVLMSCLDGFVQLAPGDFNVWIRQLAQNMAKIHAVSAEGLPWRYFSWNEIKKDASMPTWFKDQGLWRSILEVAHGHPLMANEVFIHRDYQPANVLWLNDRLAGVVDWVNGCRGNASVDVAHCRLNLALMYGLNVADKLLQAYEAEVGQFEHHPYWDMDAALSWMPDPDYYEPWREFGLGDIPQRLLRERIKEFLHNASRRM